MSVEFQISERFAGFAGSAAKEGEQVSMLCSEVLTSLNGVQLTWRLEELHSGLFSKIPGLPDPSSINSLLVVIRPDYSATAYVNEIAPTATIRPARPIAAGEPVLVSDVLELTSFNLGVDVPANCGVILVRSLGWRKALYYDLCPLEPASPPRTSDLSAILARQTLELLKGKFAEVVEQRSMQAAIEELETLIGTSDNHESRYQEFFVRRPWFLGGLHTRIERHTELDDQNIPDYTGIRSADANRDIFEIKPPFMKCFRQDQGFTHEFNESWNQAERYLDFARKQRQYLRDKGLSFENPRCYLLVGHGLSEPQMQALKVKESFNPAISVFTYEQVLSVAKAFLTTLQEASTP